MEAHLFIHPEWKILSGTTLKAQKALRTMAMDEIRKNGLENETASLSYLGNGLFHYGFSTYSDFRLIAVVCSI